MFAYLIRFTLKLRLPALSPYSSKVPSMLRSLRKDQTSTAVQVPELLLCEMIFLRHIMVTCVHRYIPFYMLRFILLKQEVSRVEAQISATLFSAGVLIIKNAVRPLL